MHAKHHRSPASTHIDGRSWLQKLWFNQLIPTQTTPPLPTKETSFVVANPCNDKCFRVKKPRFETLTPTQTVSLLSTCTLHSQPRSSTERLSVVSPQRTKGPVCFKILSEEKFQPLLSLQVSNSASSLDQTTSNLSFVCS